jgi:outer membrane lipoprotein carrier protein
MLRFICIVFTVLQFAAIAQEVKLSEKEITQFKVKVEKETTSLKSIKTDFIQTKHMDFLTKDIESKGKMYLTADEKLKWQYTEPNKYSIIFKDNKIYIDDAGKKSTIDGDQKLFKRINQLISGSVSGKLFNDDEFIISYAKNSYNVIVELTPKDKTLKKYISKVILTFPKNEATVSQVKLVEPSNDYTLITFKNKQLNTPIDEKIFSH